MDRFFCGGYEFKRESDAVCYGGLVQRDVFRETRRSDEDVVLGHGVHRYVDGGWEWVSGICPQRPISIDPSNIEQPPACAHNCIYRQKFSQFRLQRNALRSELASLIATDRCGWNLKEGRLGGHPLDYHPCTFVAEIAA